GWGRRGGLRGAGGGGGARVPLGRGGPDPGKEATPLHPPYLLLVIVGPGPARAPAAGGVRRRPRTRLAGARPRVGASRSAKLEVELVDVRLVEHERRGRQGGGLPAPPGTCRPVPRGGRPRSARRLLRGGGGPPRSSR